MTQLRFLALAAAVPCFPAVAATILFGGTAQVRLGYADNPFLDDNPPGGTIQVAGTIAPRLVRSTALGQTVLSGAYDRAQYLSHYGSSDSESVGLRHSQQLNEHLNGSAGIGYSSSRNPYLGPIFNQGTVSQGIVGGSVTNPATPDQPVVSQPVVNSSVADRSVIDALTVGQRTRTFSADAGLNWVPSRIDSFNGAVSYSSSTYGGRAGSGPVASDYKSYGANASYTRAFGARTRLGLQMVVNRTESDLYGSSTSYQPNLIIQHSLSQFWAFNGSVGGIFQRSGGPIPSSTHSLGFNGSLCGTYPRHSLCFNAGRSSQASGIGGLRTNLSFGVSASYKIDDRSRVSANASYTDSKSTGGVAGASQKFAQAGVDYSRTVSQRISVGFGGRYQWREYPILGSAHALSASVNLSAEFGRTK